MAYDFTPAEVLALVESLRHRDRAEALEAAGQPAEAVKLWTLSHRWWRSLKFAAPGARTQIGRPSGDDWSPMRAAGAADLRRSIGIPIDVAGGRVARDTAEKVP